MALKRGQKWGATEETGKLQTLNINIKTGIESGIKTGAEMGSDGGDWQTTNIKH